MKNTLKSYWKQEEGQEYVIPDEEKAEIRRDLFALLLHHQEHQVHTLNFVEHFLHFSNTHKITNSLALMIVFVIQEDFPEIWPSAIVDVMNLIPQPETSLKGMLLLYQVIKVLIKVPGMNNLLASSAVYTHCRITCP